MPELPPPKTTITSKFLDKSLHSLYDILTFNQCNISWLQNKIHAHVEVLKPSDWVELLAPTIKLLPSHRSVPVWTFRLIRPVKLKMLFEIVYFDVGSTIALLFRLLWKWNQDFSSNTWLLWPYNNGIALARYWSDGAPWSSLWLFARALILWGRSRVKTI